MSEHLSFSFRYLDTTKAKFLVKACDHTYFALVMGRLKALSEMSRKDFLNLPITGGKSWRVHRITWNDRVSESGFGLHETLTADENAWQFMLSKDNGRVHGFLIGNVFFVRWIDPDHALYPGGD